MVSIVRAILPLVIVLTACGHRRTTTTQPQSSTPPGTVLTADDIRRSPGQSLEQLLLARVPGLTLERAADGHVVMRFRGPNTFMGNEEPLFILNDIPVGPTMGGLAAIDVHDIETVQVLRDAAATAAYGVRGANGVIIIRTKQP